MAGLKMSLLAIVFYLTVTHSAAKRVEVMTNRHRPGNEEGPPQGTMQGKNASSFVQTSEGLGWDNAFFVGYKGDENRWLLPEDLCKTAVDNKYCEKGCTGCTGVGADGCNLANARKALFESSDEDCQKRWYLTGEKEVMSCRYDTAGFIGDMFGGGECRANGGHPKVKFWEKMYNRQAENVKIAKEIKEGVNSLKGHMDGQKTPLTKQINDFVAALDKDIVARELELSEREKRLRKQRLEEFREVVKKIGECDPTLCEVALPNPPKSIALAAKDLLSSNSQFLESDLLEFSWKMSVEIDLQSLWTLGNELPKEPTAAQLQPQGLMAKLKERYKGGWKGKPAAICHATSTQSLADVIADRPPITTICGGSGCKWSCEGMQLPPNAQAPAYVTELNKLLTTIKHNQAVEGPNGELNGGKMYDHTLQSKLKTQITAANQEEAEIVKVWSGLLVSFEEKLNSKKVDMFNIPGNDKTSHIFYGKFAFDLEIKDSKNKYDGLEIAKNVKVDTVPWRP